MKKFKITFLIFFIFIFFKINFLKSEIEEEIPEKEIILVLKILKAGYERSFSTINFWKNLENFLNEYKEIMTVIMSRMRNPTKNFGNPKIFFKTNLNELLENLKISYDNYSSLLNNSYENNLISEISKNYINFSRKSLFKSPRSFFKKFIFSIFNIFKKKLNLNIEKFIKKEDLDLSQKRNSSIIDLYVKLDKYLLDIHEKNCDFQIHLYQNYKSIWIYIENIRMESFRENYNKLMKILLKNNKTNFMYSLSDKELIISEKEALPLEI